MNQKRKRESAKSWVLVGGDPLLWFLTEKLRLSTPWIVCGMVALAAIVTFGVGSYVSQRLHPEVDLVRVFDPEHLYYALLVHLIYIPVITLIYLWQAKGIVDTLTALRDQNVIFDDEKDEFDRLCERMRKGLNRWYLPVATALAVSILVAIQILVAFPQQTSAMGKASFWSYDRRYYALNTAMWFLIYYVTAMVVIKGVLALGWFCYLFRRLGVRVDPFHPDGAGGMGALGSLAAKYGAIGIGFGVMAASYAFARLAAGLGWVYADSIFLFVLYLVLTPVSLLLPMWSAHERMLEARAALLSRVAAEIDTAFRRMLEPSVGHAPRGWSVEFLGLEMQIRRGRAPGESGPLAVENQLEKLQARYKLIKDTYPTWPIPIRFARNLGVVSVLPLVTGVVGLISSFLG